MEHNQLYKYRAFGLNISSEIQLPELIESEGEPDVYVKFGKTPLNIKKHRFHNERLQINENSLLLNIKHTAKYFIENGNSIIIEPYKDFSPINLRLFLLGSSMGAILYQRGLLPIHGSAVEKNGEAYIIVGKSGMGKSTLAAAMRSIGFRIITDDVSAVYLDENSNIMVLPSYPQQKLWDDSTEMLGLQGNKVIRVIENKDKYAVKVKDDFVSKPIKLKGIYEISKYDDRITNKENISISSILGVEKFKIVHKNIYRPKFCKGMNLTEMSFKLCTHIASKIKIAVIERPESSKNPLLVAQCVANNILGLN